MVEIVVRQLFTKKLPTTATTTDLGIRLDGKLVLYLG